MRGSFVSRLSLWVMEPQFHWDIWGTAASELQQLRVRALWHGLRATPGGVHSLAPSGLPWTLDTRALVEIQLLEAESRIST